VGDIPLLFEVGFQDEFDLVVLVDASPKVRLQRLVADRGLAESEAKRMIDAQMPASEKRARADLVIDNDGTPEELRERARAAWAEIQSRAPSHG
jgi:dephospho-CoA kinase